MKNILIPSGRIESRIHVIRGRNVMFDRDLAELYGVSTKVLNQAVRRNLARFPQDFMFQLTKDEARDVRSQVVIFDQVESQNLKSQIVTSSLPHGGRRKVPTVFTEQGIAMLSSVLKSEQAIAVNIQIIRIFTKLREMVAENDYLRRRVEAMELQYDQSFKEVFDAIRGLLETKEEPNEEIGFKG